MFMPKSSYAFYAYEFKLIVKSIHYKIVFQWFSHYNAKSVNLMQFMDFVQNENCRMCVIEDINIMCVMKIYELSSE